MLQLSIKEIETINGGLAPCWGPSGVVAGFVLGLGILSFGVGLVFAGAVIAGACSG